MSSESNTLELLFKYAEPPRVQLSDPELGEPLHVVAIAGGIVRMNDPEIFAATPEILATSPFIRVEVEILDRHYIVVGLTRNGDMVLKRVDP